MNFFERNSQRLAEDVTSARPIAEVEPLAGKRLKNAKAIATDQIDADPQHREHFDEEALERLAKSMASDGQLQPIRVRFDSERLRYVIIAGERRWRAAKIAGMATIDCVVVEGELTEAEILRQQIIENALREDLKPTEQGKAFVAAMEAEGLNGKELAARLNVHPSTVSRTIALLSLPEAVQAKVDRGELAMTQALKQKSETAPSPQAAKRPSKEKKIRTSLGITVTLKARKNLLDDQIAQALNEALENLRKAA